MSICIYINIHEHKYGSRLREHSYSQRADFRLPTASRGAGLGLKKEHVWAVWAHLPTANKVEAKSAQSELLDLPLDCLSVAGLRLEEGDERADEIQGFVGMDPVAGVWDILDLSCRKQTLDFWIILRAAEVGKWGAQHERKG